MKQETENRQQRPQMICLCATCANAFYNVPIIRIQRVDRYQLVKIPVLIVGPQWV